MTNAIGQMQHDKFNMTNAVWLIQCENITNSALCTNSHLHLKSTLRYNLDSTKCTLNGKIACRVHFELNFHALKVHFEGPLWKTS